MRSIFDEIKYGESISNACNWSTNDKTSDRL